METASRLRGALKGSAVIGVAMGVMNVTTYLFTILAARLLGPLEYGALAAVMGLLLVLNVLSLGLQATGARRIAAHPEHAVRTGHEVMRATYLCAAGLGAVTLAGTPLIAGLLDLRSWLVAALVAVTVVPLTVMGGQAGLLQGQRRWRPLAGIYLAVGVGRLGFGMIALAVRPDTLHALVGVAAGAVVPAVVGWWALRGSDRQPAPADRAPTGAPGDGGSRETVRWAPRGVLRETVTNSHSLLAFFALSNVDVLVARIFLDGQQAGLYAGGLILTKAVLFLPQFVVVIVFPSMSSTQSARRMNLMALGLVLVIGASTVVGSAVLSRLAVVFIGGPEYAALMDRLWIFAALGTLLAMLQLMVYNVVARQRQRAVYAIWAALAVLLVVAPLMGTVTGLVLVVLGVDAALFALLLLRAGMRPAEPVSR